MSIPKRRPAQDGPAEHIDAAQAVEAYRSALANRDSARCETEREIFQENADRIRHQWAACSGKDNLHELATRLDRDA